MLTSVDRPAYPTGLAHLRETGHAALRAERIRVVYRPTRRAELVAVDDVSIDVLPGETLGLVGESGCGKSTFARSLVQMPRPDAGSVWFDGSDLTRLGRRELRAVRRRLQLIYQDPIASLNPNMTVAEIVSEPLAIWGVGDRRSRLAAAGAVLESVGLDPGASLSRTPREFSGGQCQRICIARALIVEPLALVLDEPVSALDVSVQAQILNLLEDLKGQHELTMIFVAHDLAVVRNISDRVAVMYLGKLCEIGPTLQVLESPAHPYTSGLLAAVPRHAGPAGQAPPIDGEVPSPLDPPSGCRFRTRCPRADDRCAVEPPVLMPAGRAPDHYVACHHPQRASPAHLAASAAGDTT